MSRATLKNKRLRLEYRYLEVEKEEIEEASRESEMELRKFEWYQQLCEKALGRRPDKPEGEGDGAKENEVDGDDNEEDEFEDDEEFDEDMPEWMRWKMRRRRGTVARKRKKKIRNLLAECSKEGNDIWGEMPDWFKEMFDNINEEAEDETKSKAPKDKRLKKLYRSIVERSHPDKVGPIHLDQFRRATEAFQSGDIGELLNVADELKIPIPEGLERERGKYIEKQINEMRMFIADKKNTIGWLWAEAESEEDREAIRKRFCGIYGIQLDGDSVHLS